MRKSEDYDDEQRAPDSEEFESLEENEQEIRI